jgi:hypothetical protein
VNIPAPKTGPIQKTALIDPHETHYLQENNSICTGEPNTGERKGFTSQMDFTVVQYSATGKD